MISNRDRRFPRRAAGRAGCHTRPGPGASTGADAFRNATSRRSPCSPADVAADNPAFDAGDQSIQRRGCGQGALPRRYRRVGQYRRLEGLSPARHQGRRQDETRRVYVPEGSRPGRLPRRRPPQCQEAAGSQAELSASADRARLRHERALPTIYHHYAREFGRATAATPLRSHYGWLTSMRRRRTDGCRCGRERPRLDQPTRRRG